MSKSVVNVDCGGRFNPSEKIFYWYFHYFCRVSIFCSSVYSTLLSTQSNILLEIFLETQCWRRNIILQLNVSERQTRTDGNPSNFLISDRKLIIELFFTLQKNITGTVCRRYNVILFNWLNIEGVPPKVERTILSLFCHHFVTLAHLKCFYFLF